MIAERDAVKQIEDWLTLRCQSVNHRQLLLLCGDIDWQQSIAEATIEHFAMQQISDPGDIYPVFRELFQRKETKRAS